MIQPKLSVCIITYNHGEYLRYCIESILSQKTNFPFEIIIGDDASNNGASQAILIDYAEKYKDILKVIFRDSNIGGQKNYFDAESKCRGQYICYIDGDDAMCPGKLQAQVDILDRNSDCAVVFHDLCEINQCPSKPWDGELLIYNSTEWLKKGCFLPHSSKMYRRDAIITRNRDRLIVDFYLHIEHSINGKIFYLDHCFGQKRIHDGMITKNTKFRDILIYGHISAYDRAIELGYDKGIAIYGKIRFLQGVGLSLIMEDQYSEAMKYLSIDKENWAHATFQQKILNHLSRFPFLIKTIQNIRHILR